MKRYETLTELLQDRRDTDSVVRFIDGEDAESVVGFGDLHARALRMLALLQATGLEPGHELIIFSRSNERFLIAFWAAILGGIVPVPVAVGISDEHRMKLFRIAGRLANPWLFTEADLLERLSAFAAEHAIADEHRILDGRALTGLTASDAGTGAIEPRTADDVAFIQYSSGSTSDPKGVCLTHRNLTSCVLAMANGLALTDEDSALSWMPLTHDMGLIGYHLTLLQAGIDHTIMDTSVFVRRPLLWLSKVSELRASVLCSPNFGYKHYLKVFERKPPSDLDLSCVRLLLNGAEPISVSLCEEFLGQLSRHGLKRTAMLPVYGLAEATLAVTFPELAQEYRHVVVERHSLRIGEPYAPARPGEADAVAFVKLGSAIDGCEYRIAGDDDEPLPDGRVGHIQIRGENITAGLYRDPEGSRSLYTDDGWLRTGDCGVTVDGELVVTGRAKDIIIVNGQNYYPHDIEEIIAELDELELGKVVVCGAQPSSSQVEELLVFVLHRKDLESLAAIAYRIRDVVASQTGLEVDHVIPVARIPKTTSGKIQRSRLAEAYLDGEYDAVLADIRALSHRETEDAIEATHDPLVAELAGICNEFAKDREIGPDDNLFEVGINSLTLTEIMLAVEERYPGMIDINDLFEHPTIRELAAFLEAKR